MLGTTHGSRSFKHERRDATEIEQWGSIFKKEIKNVKKKYLKSNSLDSYRNNVQSTAVYSLPIHSEAYLFWGGERIQRRCPAAVRRCPVAPRSCEVQKVAG